MEILCKFSKNIPFMVLSGLSKGGRGVFPNFAIALIAIRILRFFL